MATHFNLKYARTSFACSLCCVCTLSHPQGMAKLVRAHTVSQLATGRVKLKATCSSKIARETFNNMMGITEPLVRFGDGDTEVISKKEATVFSAAISYQNYKHLTGQQHPDPYFTYDMFEEWVHVYNKRLLPERSQT